VGEEEFRRVLEIKEAALGEVHVDVASAVGNLAGVVRMRGKPEEAEKLARRALEIRRELLPADHPQVAASYATLANSLEELGRHAEVLPLRERVVEIVEKRYGEDHPKLVVDLSNLAYSAILAGALDRAHEAATRALQIADAHDVRPEIAAFARLVLARVMSERGESPKKIRELTDEALTRLGSRSAPAERRILGQLVERHGWKDLEAAVQPPDEG
jgi:tetratricopeptide (TPR) repeat protein